MKIQSMKHVEIKLDMTSIAKRCQIPMLEMSNSIKEQKKWQGQSQGEPIKKSRIEKRQLY